MSWLIDADVKTAQDLDREAKDRLISRIEAQRKEQEELGVTINGVRYGGEPSNRQALGEALEFANASGATTFAGWKDSDSGFHADHPVADVQTAYQAIGNRRSQLIGLEGQYIAQVEAGTLADVSDLAWLA